MPSPSARTPRPQENHLWYDFLRNYTPRFQRQKAIDGSIADFYCHDARLVIELDGFRHYTPEGMGYDKVRTQVLHAHGLDVLRFSNHDIDHAFAAVCMQIDTAVNRRLNQKKEE